jgi:hypothetical protein
MNNPNRPARLNRGLLILIALVLIAAGAFTLGTGLGMLHVQRPTAALIPTTAPPQPWVPYAVTALAILLGLLCIRWLIAQTMRRPKTGTWRWARDPDRGVTYLAPDTATVPLLAELHAYPGVTTAAAWLSGNRHTPRLHLAVTAEPDADLSALRHQIAGHALTRFRHALELGNLPTTIQFRLAAQRVRAY